MMKSVVLVALILVSCVYSQDTQDCGKDAGCFLNPANCNGNGCDHVIKWRNSSSDAGVTDYEIITRVNATFVSNGSWFGLAFADAPAMGYAPAVICINAGLVDNFVGSYWLIGPDVPIVLFPQNPSIGISDTKLSVADGYVTCKFSRVQAYDNATVPNYGNLTANQKYILTAYGPYTSQGIRKHGDTVALSATRVNFLSYLIYGAAEPQEKTEIKQETKNVDVSFDLPLRLAQERFKRMQNKNKH